MTAVRPLSVVMPVYNAAPYLRAAITSIQNQTFADFELILVDDGSTDASLKILSELKTSDPRIRVVSRPNTGIVGALNDGLALARGEFVARMDADDISEPERFDRQIHHLRNHPGSVALGSAVHLLDPASHRVRLMRRPLTHPEIENALLRGDGGALIHPAVMFRRAAVETVGRYRLEAQYVEDLDLYLRLAMIGRLENLPEVLLGYRVHPQSINFTKNQGRHATKLHVMSEAYAARGRPFNPSAFPDRLTTWADPVGHHREWAVTALSLGPRSVAIRHGLIAVRLAPGAKSSWQALRYALTAKRPRQAG